MSSRNRIAWVTGGGSGIGRAGAEALIAQGWTVIISGRRMEILTATAKELDAQGRRVDVMPVDVSNSEEVGEAVSTILGKHGRIDLLVNCAGMNLPKRSWEDVTPEGWGQIVGANLNGVLYCIHAVLPAMRAQRDGCIINVASWAGRIVSKMTGPAYTATKHAVVALTHSFNMDEFKNGLRACCLCPAEVATPIMRMRPEPPSEEVMSKMLQPQDVGKAIAFVADMPPHVCVNEILISPTWNRSFMGMI
jgi:NADP-dependent 3-hydroxy acid dehydrogenase YdfG